jgi:hypothetical protein
MGQGGVAIAFRPGSSRPPGTRCEDYNLRADQKAIGAVMPQAGTVTRYPDLILGLFGVRRFIAALGFY